MTSRTEVRELEGSYLGKVLEEREFGGRGGSELCVICERVGSLFIVLRVLSSKWSRTLHQNRQRSGDLQGSQRQFVDFTYSCN